MTVTSFSGILWLEGQSFLLKTLLSLDISILFKPLYLIGCNDTRNAGHMKNIRKKKKKKKKTSPERHTGEKNETLQKCSKQ